MDILQTHYSSLVLHDNILELPIYKHQNRCTLVDSGRAASINGCNMHLDSYNFSNKNSPDDKYEVLTVTRGTSLERYVFKNSTENDGNRAFKALIAHELESYETDHEPSVGP